MVGPLKPDLNRRWTLDDVAAELWPRGISLKSEPEGYRVNFLKGGTTHTEYVTDELLDALTVGLDMAANPPPPLPKVPYKKRPSRRAVIHKHNAEWAKRQKEKERQGRGKT